MDHHDAPEQRRTTSRSLPIAFAMALALAHALSLASPAHAGRITPPPVPAGIAVPDGVEPFFVGHAEGTQNYVCLPVGSEFGWVLYTPVATLFDDSDKQLTTHFFTPNPFEAGTVRPTWQHSRDTSTVWAKLGPPASSDPAYVAPGAVSWLLLDVVGSAAGPNGGSALTAATHIHRVNTTGGVKPATGCSAAENVGDAAIVPYTADYYFYRDATDDEDEGN